MTQAVADHTLVTYEDQLAVCSCGHELRFGRELVLAKISDYVTIGAAFGAHLCSVE